jgi:propionate CoA-transferase
MNIAEKVPHSSRTSKVMSADQAVALIPDGASIALCASGGGLLEPDALYEAVERRFLSTAKPVGLTLVHALGLGDRGRRGTNRFAHEGLVRKVIGGHWSWSPPMQKLARENKIEAYSLPGGVIAQMFREIGAGRPGLYTKVGLGTFVDPRLQGGRINGAAKDSLCEVVEIDGSEYLRYRPYKVDVALIRGSIVDPDGNVSLDQECANLDVHAAALAAHNSGGLVIVQARTLVERGAIRPRSVRIPSVLVDAIVIEPAQMQNYDTVYDPGISGEANVVMSSPPQPFGLRKIVARRAAMELVEGNALNFGFGMPDGIPKLLTELGRNSDYYQTIEHGTYGGMLLDGTVFGTAYNATAMLDSPSQFDFYSGGGLDIAFLGFGEIDQYGNVNVSMLGGNVIGPGGFIDIAYGSKKVVFCGSFDAKETEIDTGDGTLRVIRNGKVCKFVKDVAHITFSGREALRRGKEVLYVTERAVFRLTEEGVTLIEAAPGVDIANDVVNRMHFRPVMREVSRTDASIFRP